MAKKTKKTKTKSSDKQRKAEEAKRLKAEKKARKAKKAEEKAAKAKAGKGSKAAPAEQPAKPDQVELLKLALRSTEARLVDAEQRLRQVQQQLDDERRALAEAASGEQLLEDAVVDAAVQATVTEVLLETEVEVLASGAEVSPAELVEAVAEQLDEVADEAAPAPEEVVPSGDAEAAAEVFEQAGVVAEDDLTPPVPAAPEPGEPNASWTLLRLREEAKRRGLQGTSSLPKAALLERLQQV